MDSIKNIISSKTQKSPISRQVNASMAVEYFSAVAETILGPKMGKRAQALYLKEGVMTIACLSSAVAQELQFNQKKVITRVNKKLGKDLVEKLRFLS